MKKRIYKTVALHPETHLLVRIAAAESGVTIMDWVEDAITQKLKKEEADARRRA